MMTDSAVPLLRRTPLLPGESLPSLLERLAQLNHYGGTAILTLLCQTQREPPMNRDKPACPFYGSTFLRLTRLTQLPAAELWAASAHRFTPTLAPSGGAPAELPWLNAPNQPNVLPALTRLHLRPTTAAQYCPLCLQKTPCHQLSWIPVAATLCLEHQCLLVDRCLGCQRPVTIADVVQRRCRTCRADLSAAAAVLVTGDDLGLLAQQMIQSWFAVAPAPTWDTEHLCPAQSPALRYRLLEHLSRRLLDCREAWATWPTPLPGLDEHTPHIGPRARRLAPNQAYYLYRAAFTALVDWPQGLFSYLDTYSSRCTPDAPATRHTKRLGVIQKDWLAPAWRALDDDLCIQAFVDYLRDRDIPFTVSLVNHLKDVSWFVDKTGLWTEQRAAQALGLARQDLGRFQPQGPLGPCRWPLERADAPFFDRAKVLAIHQRWHAARGWSLSDTCCWLGLDEAAVLLLVARGLLTPLPTPGNAVDLHRWSFDRQAVAEFFDRVAERTEFTREGHHGLVNLDEAIRRLGYAAIDPATLLQGVVAGVVPAYRRCPELSALRQLCFPDLQLYSLPKLLQPRPGWVKAHHFTWGTGLALGTVLGWVEAGLIQPQAGTNCYFELQRLQELAAPYLSLPPASLTICEMS